MASQITLNRSHAVRGSISQVGVGKSSPARLALAAPRQRPAAKSAQDNDWFRLQANKPVSTVLTGLSIVLGALLFLTWIARKRMPKGSARLPEEIIEVLGRTTLAAKQSLHLVRVGGKLIVVSVTATGTKTLTEITDAGEVARILAACQQQHPHSSTVAFRQTFEQLGNEPARGYLGSAGDRGRSSSSDKRAA